jgi:hypothetical protein
LLAKLFDAFNHPYLGYQLCFPIPAITMLATKEESFGINRCGAFRGTLQTLVAAVVFTVKVAVAALVPETVTEAGTEHVGRSL